MAFVWSINYTLRCLPKRVKTKERICLLIKKKKKQQQERNAHITSVRESPRTRPGTASADHPPALALYQMTLQNNTELCAGLEYIVLKEYTVINWNKAF